MPLRSTVYILPGSNLLAALIFVMSAVAKYCYIAPRPQLSCLARSANVPEGLYILLALISFLTIALRTIISGSAGPIFAIFSPNESVLGGASDDRSGPLFPISQGTLPWQPIL